jgi:hypothetical protein
MITKHGYFVFTDFFFFFFFFFDRYGRLLRSQLSERCDFMNEWQIFRHNCYHLCQNTMAFWRFEMCVNFVLWWRVGIFLIVEIFFFFFFFVVVVVVLPSCRVVMICGKL